MTAKAYKGEKRKTRSKDVKKMCETLESDMDELRRIYKEQRDAGVPPNVAAVRAMELWSFGA